MPRQGNGTYTLPAGNPVVTGTPITAAWSNTTLDDIAVALTGSLAADGQTTMLANQSAGGFRHTNVGKALATTSYARADQVQQMELAIVLAGTMPAQDQYSGTLPLGATTFTQWQMIFYAAPASNVGAMTLNINGSGPKAIVHADGSASVLGDFIAGALYGLTWDGSAWRFINASSDYAALDARYLRLAGGAMTGVLQVVAPAGNNDATPKVYVDTGDAAKLNLSGGTMTGALTLSGDPVTALQAATRQFVLSSVIGSVAGVSSFNTRTGAVALTSGDVTTALTFTPYNATNPAGFITGITGAQVNAALGFTPYSTAGGTITGNVTLAGNGTVTSKFVVPVQVVGAVPIGAPLDFNIAQNQYLELSGEGLITGINNLPVGATLTVIIHNNTASTHNVQWTTMVPIWQNGQIPQVLVAGAYFVINITRATATVMLGGYYTTA